ncbi:hypothetical protein LCGC14_1541080 [marine sediment metagenome]|uniref:Uncharacterized protein n=1 Tax=marine sediment metagenome TaxID=412755 RepID=A0A0F9IT39_9ZZZZ
MEEETNDSVRAAMRDYLRDEDITQEGLGGLIGCTRVALNRYLNKHTEKIQGGAMGRFKRLNSKRKQSEPRKPYNPDVDDPFLGIAAELHELAEFLEDETFSPHRKFSRYNEDIRVHLKHLEMVRGLVAELSSQPRADH